MFNFVLFQRNVFYKVCQTVVTKIKCICARVNGSDAVPTNELIKFNAMRWWWWWWREYERCCCCVLRSTWSIIFLPLEVFFFCRCCCCCLRCYTMDQNSESVSYLICLLLKPTPGKQTVRPNLKRECFIAFPLWVCACVYVIFDPASRYLIKTYW